MENKYYYEEIDKREQADSGSPLKFQIFENISQDGNRLMAWCYEEDFAKKLVKALNDSENPISAFAFEIANIITKHNNDFQRYGRTLQAKILHFSSLLKNEDKKAFDEYFELITIKNND